MSSLKRWRQVGQGQFHRGEQPGEEFEGTWWGVCEGAAVRILYTAHRTRYNRAAAMQGTRGELTDDLSVPHSLTESHRR